MSVRTSTDDEAMKCDEVEEKALTNEELEIILRNAGGDYSGYRVVKSFSYSLPGASQNGLNLRAYVVGCTINNDNATGIVLGFVISKTKGVFGKEVICIDGGGVEFIGYAQHDIVSTDKDTLAPVEKSRTNAVLRIAILFDEKTVIYDVAYYKPRGHLWMLKDVLIQGRSYRKVHGKGLAWEERVPNSFN